MKLTKWKIENRITGCLEVSFQKDALPPMGVAFLTGDLPEDVKNLIGSKYLRVTLISEGTDPVVVKNEKVDVVKNFVDDVKDEAVKSETRKNKKN